jgi:hypothetical protein
MVTSLCHFLEISNGQLGHLLQLVYKSHPLFNFLNEVPRVGEIEHDDEKGILQELRSCELAINGGVVDFLNHIDFEFGVGTCVEAAVRLSGSLISMTLR